MRIFTIILFLLPIIFSNVLANGVAIVDSKTGSYLKLIESKVEVTVENQVAVVTTTQKFINTFTVEKRVKFGFPMPEGASATELLFKVDQQWYQANFSPTPQDTTLPGGEGGEITAALKSYLGDTPLYFNLDYPVKKDSVLTVRLRYVQLLAYEFGNVKFDYPNNYSSIQNTFINTQEFNFTLKSERTITLIGLLDLSPDAIFNDGHTASIHFAKYEEPANFNYKVEYTLSPDELGLFSMSTFLPDSTVPDEYGSGFFTFIVEPDPSENAETIEKIFTFIIDRSGSMSGNKIVQARDAATFIVEHLNDGDKFNIVDFSGSVTSFRSSHVEYNSTNESAALNYISGINATGSTNIAGAFQTAITQFSSATETTANIIIFFTDGNATSGSTTSTEGIVNLVADLQNQNETDVSIFTFGIGSFVNKQLLTRLAAENNGFAEFLGNDELEERITNFYLTIRNPVMLNTQLSFEPAVAIETYPKELPNLYKGQQLLISGRYANAQTVGVTLTGEAFGKQVTYNYDMVLTDSSIQKNQFLTKIWAKAKIEDLLVQYYSLYEGSEEAQALKDQVVTISVSYGVLSPFTSFSEGDPIGDPTSLEELTDEKPESYPNTFEVLGNYPNPFNPTTHIRIRVNGQIAKTIAIRIYNALGQLIKTILFDINGAGTYEVLWDGTLTDGSIAPSGSYYYIVDFGNGLSGGKMTLLK
jgi:Ca-activated chloride channel homolog